METCVRSDKAPQPSRTHARTHTHTFWKGRTTWTMRVRMRSPRFRSSESSVAGDCAGTAGWKPRLF
eukprot:8051256-Alexandrium_andersonii.AAC.1